MPKMYVTRWVPPEALAMLRRRGEVKLWNREEEPVPRAELVRNLKEVHGLFCLLTDKIDEGLLQEAPSLKVVSNMAVGYDNIDVAACHRRGIVVCHTPGVLTEATADLTWALLLATARRLGEAERCLRQGQWSTWSPMFLAGAQVSGATLGIIGLGAIGTAVAHRAAGFGMRILYHHPRRRPEPEAALGAEQVTLPALLEEADFVSLHVPLREDTHHLLGEEELRMMKPTACLINTARGAVVDQEALVRVMKEGHLFGAGLDVYASEPLPPASPLLTLPNVVLLPHIGSATVATRTAMAVLAAQNLLRVLEGKAPHHRVECGRGQSL